VVGCGSLGQRLRGETGILQSYGRLTFRKPIVQFDLKNNWQGLHPIDVNGANFNLGENTGLQNYFVDTNVKNGQTYYYAIVSYDHGLVDTVSGGEFAGISPAECTSRIQKDVAGNVKVDINTAVVTPRSPAAGYEDPSLNGNIVREAIAEWLREREF